MNNAGISRRNTDPWVQFQRRRACLDHTNPNFRNLRRRSCHRLQGFYKLLVDTFLGDVSCEKVLTKIA